MAAELGKFPGVTTITCHSWNKDGTKVALCPNNNEVHIYKKTGNTYALEVKLAEHDQVVTGIDWGHVTNRIVTCSQDRNAYVWTLTGNEWKPVLVILRVNRAATHVKWSPLENKFAVACGAKLVSVCSFEEDNDWWVSKHIKKHKSTVTQVAWHPNNALLATASTDFKARIFSAFIKGVDKTVPQTPFGNRLPFGELFAEIPSNGWVQSVRWSPSGNVLGFTGQDSTVHFANISSGTADVTTVKHRDLPFRDLLFTNENNAVAVGHDCTPVLFSNNGGWKFSKKVDAPAGAGAGAVKAVSAREMFQKTDTMGTATNETTLSTKHQNTISCVQPFTKSGENVSKYSTTGLDGAIVIWSA
jgi:actin related protein 2/3 complex subunit 1A/1B